MKTLTSTLAILLLFSIVAKAQKNYNKTTLENFERYKKESRLDSFTILVYHIISTTTKNNISDRLVLIDSLYSKSDGAFGEGLDTCIAVLQKDYFLQCIKYLSHRQNSNIEAGFINYQVNISSLNHDKNTGNLNFESRIKSISPSLNTTEKKYAEWIKSEINRLIKNQ